MTATEAACRPPSSRLSDAPVAIGAVLSLAVGTGLVLLLHVIPPTDEISPIRRTISEYGLSTNKWIFNIAVVLVAAGSAALFAVHFARRTLLGVSAVAGALWTVSLLVIVGFPKANWAIGGTTDGVVHRIASVVGFFCLPAGILAGSGRLFAGLPGPRRLAQWLGVVSLLWFGVILGAIVASVLGGGRWWLLIPLGLIERLMALTEVLAVALLAIPVLAGKPAADTAIS